MKNHLKRIAVPRTWHIDRKAQTFILRPHPGAHSLEMGLPLGVLLRDNLKLASTMREAQKLLHNSEVLVDGVRRKDRAHLVGLFDRVSFPALSKQYHLTLDTKGRLVLAELEEKQAGQKVCRVVGKTILAGGKTQLNLYDGKNILTDKKDVSVGDSVLVTLPSLAIKKVLPLKVGSSVFLFKGKHVGSAGTLKSLEGDTAIYTLADGQDIETTKRYLFVQE